MIITAVRHGETNENALGIAQGQSYGTLSVNGEQQIVALGERLKDEVFDAVISSDLPRCRATTAAILAHHTELTAEFDPRLRERSVAPLEGLPFEALGDPEISGFDVTYKTSEGESWNDVSVRLRDFITALLQLPHGRVLLVTHGGPLRCLDSILSGTPLERTIRNHYENCAVREWNVTAEQYGIIAT